jgi:membrane-bound metal-dependent hydrolase YbcI (DUF457 family)
MPLPIAHSLVGASVVAFSRPRGSLKSDWPLLLFGAFLAISPDFDFLLIWSLHLRRGLHRGPTHSIFIALIVTGLMLIGTGFSHIRSVLACGAAFLSHGLLDFLTTKWGGGVKLLWPFSDERLKLGLVGFSEFPQGFNLMELVKSSLIELMAFAPILLAVLLMRGYLLQHSAMRETQSNKSFERPAR